MEPEAILDLFFSRSERAVDACRAQYGAALRGLALRITGSARDAEECESDAYLAAWRSIPPLRPVSLRAWLLRAVRSSAIDCLKHCRAQKRGGGEAEAVLQELEDCLPAPGKVETAVDAQTLSEAVNAFLADQPARARRVFVLRCFACTPVPEIARSTGMSEQAVRSLLHRTRCKLRAFLQKEDLL